MTDTSTTDGDNLDNGAAGTDSTTSTEPTSTSTDNQPAGSSDNLDESSKSTESSAGGDKSTDGNKEEAPASTQFDSDLDDWISKRGLKAETDAEKQSLQDLRNEQREYTKSRQADVSTKSAKELSEEVKATKPESKGDDDDDLDPLEKRLNEHDEQLQQERTTRLQGEFYHTNSVTPEEHQAILDIYKQKVSTPGSLEGRQKAFDIWSSPDALPDLLDLAKARLAKGADTSAVADEAARKERERIARESQASSPGRGARTTTSGEKTEEQQRLERFKNWD